MKKMIDLIASRRFAIYLLVISTAIILLSNLLPKPYIMTDRELQTLRETRPLIYALSESYNVAEVTKSPVFVAISVFLFLSITLCTLKRTKSFLARMKRMRPVPPIASLSIRENVSTIDPEAAEKIAREVFTRGRWSVVDKLNEGRRLLYARKGAHGFWGSLAFHVGMCLVLVGALFSAFTRYNGKIVLTEGFGMNPQEIVRGLSKEELKRFPLRGIKLERLSPAFKGPFPVDYNADIFYVDMEDKIHKETVGVNAPLHAGKYQFLLTRYGFAPRFLLKDLEGKKVSEDVFILAVITPEHEDSFQLIRGLFDVKVRFYPDYYKDEKNAVIGTRSRIPRNPVFSLTISRDGKEIAAGLLPKGEELTFANYRLEFVDLYHWIQLDISKDSGMPFIMAGFFLIVAGLLVRVMLSEKSIWVIIENGEIGIGGRTRYFPALFEEELKRMAENIGKT